MRRFKLIKGSKCRIEEVIISDFEVCLQTCVDSGNVC